MRHLGAHRIGDRQRIGHRLLDHTERHGIAALEASDAALVARVDLNRGHVAQPDQIAIDIAQDHLFEVLHRVEVGGSLHRQLPVAALDRPASSSTFCRRSASSTSCVVIP